jgi:hypothetical protein
MFVHVVAVHVMKVPIMQIVDVTVVAHGRVPAIRAMNVQMIAVLRVGAGCRHDRSSACWLLKFYSNLAARYSRRCCGHFLARRWQTTAMTVGSAVVLPLVSLP